MQNLRYECVNGKFTPNDGCSDGANSILAAEAVQRLWEDLVVQQPEQIPLRASFCLEVPEDPTLGFLLEDTNLCRDVELRVVLELITPLIDVIDVIARADSVTIRIPPVVPRADLPAIEPSCAIGHCGRPLRDDCPVVGVLIRS